MPEQNTKFPDNLQAALTHAKAGLPVFPCGPDKRPLVKWKDRASTDPAQLRRWWSKWPDAMPGLPMGRVSGLAVLDLDKRPDKNGMAALRDLGFDPESLSPCIIATPSGGQHVYFQWTEGLGNSAAGLPAGVDVRGQGGYVIAPGAVNGVGVYAGQLLPDLPVWPEGLRPARPEATGATSGTSENLQLHHVKEALLALPNNGDEFSSRDDWLNIGAALHHGTDGDGLALWHEWSAQHPSYNEGDTDSVWESFQRSDGPVRTFATIRAEAERRGWIDLSPFDDCATAEELAEIDELIGLPATTKDADWGNVIRVKGKPVNNLNNTIVYLGRNLDSILPGLRHNLMTRRDEWSDGPLNDPALALARTGLEQRGLKTVGKELVADAAMAVARFRQYHPIRDALTCLTHDGHARLDTWLVRHAGVTDSAYVRAVGRKFLIQMVARVMEPGCKADHTLVLSGPQGQNKSTACRVLAGAEYFSDTLPSIAGDKTDAIRHLQGKWLVELAELAPSRKSETEDLKAFLSGAVDRVRLPYARFDESFPRQCVFIGTTNEDQFLRDATGGRRFWPVTVGKVIDIEALTSERDQLFAEAFASYKAGEPWWLDRDFEVEHARPVQEAARESDSWADDVAAWLDKPADEFDDAGSVKTHVTVSDVLSGALGITSGQHTMALQKRAANVLRGMGWKKTRTMRGIVWRAAT